MRRLYDGVKALSGKQLALGVSRDDITLWLETIQFSDQQKRPLARLLDLDLPQALLYVGDGPLETQHVHFVLPPTDDVIVAIFH